MASLENRTGYFNVIFYFGGQRFVRSLKTADEHEAEAARTRLEQNIRLVHGGRLDIPKGADVPTFLLSDGKLNHHPLVEPSLTLSQLFETYFSSLPPGSKEETTLYGMRIHRKHLQRVLGRNFRIQSLSTDDVQRYVNARAHEKGIRGSVTANTINKELTTLRTVWRWAVDHGKLEGNFPRRGIQLPKGRELPRFQTMEEIKRQIVIGVLPDEEADLWDALYLTMRQVAELLQFVKQNAAFPFIHPMFAFAAYTGARRSEMIRSQISDIDFEAKMITIRERKRVRGKSSTRRLPLAPPLARVLRSWMKKHPGGPHTFCHERTVPRSKKSDLRIHGPIPLSRSEAHHHFRFTLQESKWDVLRGWHTLRHSFISNCASRGIDQRMIDEWVGHTTEPMRRRYRHLFPSSQQQALKALFR